MRVIYTDAKEEELGRVDSILFENGLSYSDNDTYSRIGHNYNYWDVNNYLTAQFRPKEKKIIIFIDKK